MLCFLVLIFGQTTTALRKQGFPPVCKHSKQKLLPESCLPQKNTDNDGVKYLFVCVSVQLTGGSTDCVLWVC